MSKITVAFESFVAGASSVLLLFMLFGNHTSMFAQGPPIGIGVTGAEPTVPPLGPLMSGVGLEAREQPLDGLNCEQCTFGDVTFTYGGGAVRLIEPELSGTIRLNLKGAAANTAVTIAFLQAMLQNQKPPAVNPNKPIIKTATAKAVFRADLVTPYGQK
jgi:hypothetical protein